MVIVITLSSNLLCYSTFQLFKNNMEMPELNKSYDTVTGTDCSPSLDLSRSSKDDEIYEYELPEIVLTEYLSDTIK